MVAEDSIFLFIQNTPADDAKVGLKFFAFSRVAPPAFMARAEVQRNRSHVRHGGAFTEAVVTGSKNGSKDAWTRNFFTLANYPKPVSLAASARCFRYSNCVRSIPKHGQNVLLAAFDF